MRDEECVQFLQSVLPEMRLRWPGFRKVRAQVCKRIQRRVTELALADATAYRRYLDKHGEEWQHLDTLCRISVSRFYRDKQVFEFLAEVVLPALAQRAEARGDSSLSVWSAGAASGEEPYTLAIIWRLQVQQHFPDLRLQAVATEADSYMLARSLAACYDYSSIKQLPPRWREMAFDRQAAGYCLKREYRELVQFRRHDLRQDFAGLFSNASLDLVFCRNLAFTYFAETLQQQTFARLRQVLRDGGALVIGIHEQLPPDSVGIRPWSERLQVFEKTVI